MKRATAIHWAAWLTILAPLVLFGLLLVLSQLPQAVDFMPDSGTPPRYQPFTTWLFVFCAAYAYPVTLVFVLLGLQHHVLHAAHLAAVCAYSLALSYVFYRFFTRIRHRDQEI